jgi:sugar phosphate isomerase/epimerase
MILSLNTATIKQAGLQLQIETAAEAGFDAVGLWMDDIERSISNGLRIADIAEMVHSAGLSVAELCYLPLCSDKDRPRVQDVFAYADKVFSAASVLQCPVVVGVPAMTDGQTDLAENAMRDLGNAAQKNGVRVAVEFPANARVINSLSAACGHIRRISHRHIVLLVDTFHFHLSGSSLDDLRGITADELALVHVSDAMDLPREQLFAYHDNRTFPGEGIIDYAPIGGALAECGYHGALSLEIWNQSLLKSNPAATARRGVESLRRMAKESFNTERQKNVGKEKSG